MKTPTISALITCYNYGRYVTQAIESALAQSLPPLEIVVVDDGSTDDSAMRVRLLAEQNPAVRLITQPNSGQLAALRRGCSEAGGEVIALLDADDYWDADYFAALSESFSSSLRPDFVFSNMRYTSDRTGLVFERKTDFDYGISVIHGAFAASYQYAPTSGNALRRSLMQRLVDVPDSMLAEWKTRADDCIGYGADILGAHKVYLGRPRVNYRSHGQNLYLDASRTKSSKSAYKLRREKMFAYYRAVAGLHDHDRLRAPEEFRNKPEVTRRMLRAYLRVVWRAGQQPFFSRLKAVVQILGTWLARRKPGSSPGQSV